MPNLKTSDAPILDPDDDLLGMAEYGKTLADFIRTVDPPFTIGIYGEWGDGKSSYVELAHYYLSEAAQKEKSQDVVFISFGAWPYTTSDELWRALVLEIARVLYNVPEDVFDEKPAASGETAPKTVGLLPLIDQFLRQDALAMKKPAPPPDPNADFKTLVSKLDRKLSARIERQAKDHMEINQEAALLAVVSGMLSALGPISPLLAQVRAFLGLKPEIKLTELFQQKKNESTREAIQSVKEFQEEFARLFATQASGKRVCVFIDDLDRCLPNVALDLLEAVKIFLGDVDCIFIVAADQQLIGQGLRLRYRDLYESSKTDYIDAYLGQKGQQYFEKIIQLGIPVPPRTDEQAHEFISAQFPRWTPATDLIQAASGHNPRRLKQFCNLLSFNYSVYQNKSSIIKGEG